MLWLGENERRLIWWRAARRPWKQITHELGVDRSTAWRQHKLALTKITVTVTAAGLEVDIRKMLAPRDMEAAE